MGTLCTKEENSN